MSPGGYHLGTLTKEGTTYAPETNYAKYGFWLQPRRLRTATTTYDRGRDLHRGAGG